MVDAAGSHISKVERIFRVLLSRKIPDLTWYRIAKEADVSYGWAHRVLKRLETRELIKGTEIIEPRELFQLWASRKDLRVYREYHVQDPSAFLKSADLRFAFTGYFAESLVGHYLFPRYMEIYIYQNEARRWNDLITKSGYVGKGNLQVILADEHVFFESDRVNGSPLVSIQQLIVDLYRTGVECTEAADLLVRRWYA
jgi:predicted AAA+ superfamily ATPase